MTQSLAELLTALTIIAAGTLLATIIVSILPTHRRTVLPVLVIASGSIASVAFGTEIAQTLPQRIVAKHAVSNAYAKVREDLPELAILADKDPLISYELSAAFHNAYMAQEGGEAVRVMRAVQSLGLVVQQAFLRDSRQISDEAAQQIIAIERQLLEAQGEIDPRRCDAATSVEKAQIAAPTDPRLRDLRAAEFRAKLQALNDRRPPLPVFEPAQRAMFETQLFAQAGSSDQPALAPCHARFRQIIGFYAALQQQPVSMQGRWLRSREAVSVAG